MTQVVTELIVDGSGALRVLGQFEDGMEGAAVATQKSTGAIDRYQAAIAKVTAAQEKGLAITTQRVDRISKEQRAYEAWSGSIDRAVGLEIRLRRDAEKAAVAAANAVAFGYTTQEEALRRLGMMEARHAQQLAEMTTDATRAAAAINSVAVATDTAAVATRRLGAANDNHRRGNLGYQIFDIAQTGALGMNPAMILMQQGPQILQLYAGQGGVNAALQDTAAILGGIAKRFAPIGVAAAAAALVIKGFQDEINETAKVQVTFGDVAKATWQVLIDQIEEELRPAIRAIAPEAEDAWDAIRDGSGEAFNSMVQGVTFAYESVKFHISSIPDLFIYAGQEAANGFVKAIVWMVNEVLNALRGIAEAMNGFIDRNGGEALREKLGWDAGNWIPENLDGVTLEIGGADALENLQDRAVEYQKTVAEIARSDYAGKLMETIGGQAGKNAVERLAEAAKNTKGAGRAAREAQREFDSFVRTADRLAEKLFPGQYAKKEAEELTAALDKYGEKLTDVQRLAVEMRIADQFEAARLGVRELEKDTKNASEEMAKDLQDTLGSVLSDLFSQPMEDLDEFLDGVIDGFARLGAANLERAFDGLFSGSSGAAPANDNDKWAGMRKAVEVGARDGAFSGSATGTLSGLGALGDLFKGPKGAVMGAGLGAFGMGASSGSPLTGALGGALSGFGAAGSIGSAFPALAGIAGPVGLIGGAVLGFLGGIFGKSRQKRQERKQAQGELENNMGAIRELIDSANGTSSGDYESAWRQMSDEISKARKLASKAGDSALVKELDEASQNFFDFLVKDWRNGLDGVIKAMKSGHGMDSAFVQAQQEIIGLQDALVGFVEDAKFFAETGGDLEKARLTKKAADNSTTGSAFKTGLDDPKRYYDPVSAEYRIAVARYKAELKKLDINAILTTGTGKETSEIAAFDSVDALMKKMTDLGVVFDDLGNILTGDQIKDRIDKEKELQKSIKEAQEAAQEMARRQLTGAEEFTAIELKIQTLEGTAAGLQTTLEKLGMTADEAADAIEEDLTEALKELTENYVKDLSRSLNELSGAGYINDVTDAMKLYEERLKESKALGLDTSMAFAELTLALKQISNEAGLSGKDLEYLAKLFPDLASILKGISPTGGVAEAQAAVDRAKADLRAAYDEEARAIEATIGRLESFISSIEDFKASLRLDNQLSPLSPSDKLIEAQKRFQEISTKALAGDEAAMGELEDVSRQYLTEARAYYASSEQYFAIFEQVEAILDQALSSAKGQLSLEEKSLSALETQVSKLIDINDSVLSVADGIAALTSAVAALDGLGGNGSGFDPATHWSKSLKDFYGQLQAYKKETGTNVAPSEIASVWSAFASAGSGKEYDMLARAYTEILKSLMPKSGMQLGGIVGTYAQGGIVGNGLFNVDSVIARYAGGGNIALAGGEQIIRATSVTGETRPFLEHVNRTGTVPSNDNSAVVAELRAVKAELAALRAGQTSQSKVVAAGAEHVAAAVNSGAEATREVGRKFGKQDLRRPA
ncbi:phage tail length tape measure family protein [Shinella sp.]|uniref:phage tail length tape measure family protein n=1 Tax=Shinella sp. TaxID=1870904 RepID=UPI003F6F47C3